MISKFSQPVFVLGLPRSGTSLIAAALHGCGAFVGETVPGGGPENPLGFFENTYIREKVNKQILDKIGADPLGVSALPALKDLPKVKGLAETLRDLLLYQGYKDGDRWLFKDAKLTLLWPIYLSTFPDARWVIVRRRDEDIITSCLKTGFMRQHSDDPAFWQRWIDDYKRRLERLKQESTLVYEIWPHNLMDGQFSDLETLVGKLGLDWNESEVSSLINPAFWHAA